MYWASLQQTKRNITMHNIQHEGQVVGVKYKIIKIYKKKNYIVDECIVRCRCTQRIIVLVIDDRDGS